MAWKKPQSDDSINLKKQTVGSTWEGVYIEKKMIEGDWGVQALYKFINDEDKPYAIWGCASLDWNMDRIPLNSTVKIKFTGLKEIRQKQCAQVEVDYNDGKD